MKFPLSWLKEYIEIDLPPVEIAKILTFSGIEVDSFERAALSFDKVVVAEVLEVTPHPNADKLQIAQVTDGSDQYRVVCGAPNCRKGLRTALALLGSSLTFPDGETLKIKKTKIRGEESFGMLCSGEELGLSTESEGILEFAAHIPIGTDLSELYADTIFEVSLTPNLFHASSLYGIARELSAATGIPLKKPIYFLKEDEELTKSKIAVTVEENEDCPRYACRIIENIENGPSPAWMQKRLTACGFRPINLAADISNYVLLELGHPLHAFDLDKIEGKELIIRRAKPNEKLETLDGKERLLSPDVLLIADVKGPLAAAGIMGGAFSEVTSTTKRVLFEAAYFNPGTIRKGSKELALSTEASKRFERGVDPNGVEKSLQRAAMLFQEIQQVKLLSGMVEESSKNFPEKKIHCRLSRINHLLGTQLSLSEVETIFQRLHFGTHWDGVESWTVTVPTFRVDIQAEVDLVEEVARMVGYEKIPRRAAKLHGSEIPHSPLFDLEREVRERFIAEGLQEFLNCDLIGPAILEKVPEVRIAEEAVVKVLNPTSIEQSIMRTSLLQGLLEVAKYNFDHENQDVSGFEVGRVHFKTPTGYQEPVAAAIMLMGRCGPYYPDPQPKEVDFYDLKGIIENLFEGLGIKRFSFRFSHLSTFHTGRQAMIQVDGEDIGSMGEIHPVILRKLDLPKRVYFAELNLDALQKAKRTALKMKPLPAFPASERDWTVTVGEKVPVQQLIGSIQHIPSNLLEAVTLVDVFRSDKLGAHKKNVTLHFVYRDLKKTVEQLEVDTEHARIIAQAEQMLGE